VSLYSLKEATAFVLEGQTAQEAFLLIRFSLENEYSSFFQTPKTLTEGSSVKSQQTKTLICTATETSKSAKINCFYFPDHISSHDRVCHISDQGTKTINQ